MSSSDIWGGIKVPEADEARVVSLLRTTRPEFAQLPTGELLGSISREERMAALARSKGIPFLPFDVAELLEIELAQSFEIDLWRRGQMFPVGIDVNTVTIATSNPYSREADYIAQQHTDKDVVVIFTTTDEVVRALTTIGGLANEARKTSSTMLEEEDQAAKERRARVFDLRESYEGNPARETIRKLLYKAVQMHASDVHLIYHLTDKAELTARFRRDGWFADDDDEHLDASLSDQIDRLLLDQASVERDIPKTKIDVPGHFQIRHEAPRAVDVRYQRLPHLRGFRIILRILDKTHVAPDFAADHMKFSEATMVAIDRAISLSYGLIVMSGPTGSGKSTTLTAMVRRAHKPTYATFTLEHPVESEIQGVTHCDLGNEDEFPEYMKALVRCDPDQIMGGEVRSPESAKAVIDAATSGHLVLTTVHANNAADIIIRFQRMEVERWLIASVLCLACAQRLVRNLCTACRVPVLMSKRDCLIADLDEKYEGREIFAANPRGCSECKSGYKGRRAVIELLPIDRESREEISSNPQLGALGIEKYIRARHPDLLSLNEQCKQLLFEGAIDLEQFKEASQ